jgi:hypothetical protein
MSAHHNTSAASHARRGTSAIDVGRSRIGGKSTRALARIVWVLAVLSATLGLAACGPFKERADRETRILGKRVNVVVTTDGGRELVVQHNLRFQGGMTALDALKAVADVRMAQNGVVAQVNGIGGGRITAMGPEKAGWFYRINGIEADKDPDRFRLSPGTSLWWDLRRYDIYQRIPVAIGVFPEPLFTGYRDTVRPLRIVYGTKFKKDAELFRDETFDKLDPEVDPIEDIGTFGRDSDARTKPNVAVRKDRANLVIARWEEARLDPYVADIGLDPRGYGLTVWVEGTDIRAQPADAEFSTELGQAEGLVWASTIDGEPDSAIVVMVTGITDEGVRAAARALRRGAFQYFIAGAVDRDGKVIDIPRPDVANGQPVEPGDRQP